PDLSPATRRIAERHGSKTSRMRTSLVPLEPGRSSFKFLIFEPVIVSTSGRPERGPGAAERVDGVVHQVGGLCISGLEVVQPCGDLAGEVDVPITHSLTIANPIAKVARFLAVVAVCQGRHGERHGVTARSGAAADLADWPVSVWASGAHN